MGPTRRPLPTQAARGMQTAEAARSGQAGKRTMPAQGRGVPPRGPMAPTQMAKGGAAKKGIPAGMHRMPDGKLMKNSDMADKGGRAMKRKTADAKGRAMKKRG